MDVTREKEIIIGKVESCVGKGEIQAFSDKHNAYSGGIVSVNEESSAVTLCSAFAEVKAEAPGIVYDFAGGVVGNNRGTVTKCLCLGTLATHDEDSLNGAICGATVLSGEPYFSGYWVSCADNLSLQGELHAFGGLLVTYADRLYSAAYLEKGSDARLLDLSLTIYETQQEAEAAFEELKKQEVA